MKKLTALLLAAIMATTVFTGCGSEAASNEAASVSTESSGTEEERTGGFTEGKDDLCNRKGSGKSVLECFAGRSRTGRKGFGLQRSSCWNGAGI